MGLSESPAGVSRLHPYRSTTDPGAAAWGFLLARHRGFWRCEAVDRPLVGVYLGGFLHQDIYRVAREGDLLRPGQLAPQPFSELMLERCQALRGLDQDLVRPAEPPGSVPWLEAALGCPIRVQSESIWAEPLLAEDKPLEALQPATDQAWVEAILRFVRALVNQFAPTFPIAGPFLRGPADVVAAMIGAARLCHELVDHPAGIRRLIAVCAEAWMVVSRQVVSLIPPWRDGYVPGARWIHAPGPCTYTSEDITCLLSPKTYQEFFLPANRHMAARFPYGFMHRHSVSIQHLDALLDLPPGWAVEVTMDPTGPSVSEILPTLRRIQEAGRPLIVFGLTDAAEVERLMAGLSPQGLCVIVHAEGLDQATDLLAAARWKGVASV